MAAFIINKYFTNFVAKPAVFAKSVVMHIVFGYDEFRKKPFNIQHRTYVTVYTSTASNIKYQKEVSPMGYIP